MLDDFHQPSVVDGIEESTDVRVEYPVLCWKLGTFCK